MYVVLNDGNGSITSYGFYPNRPFPDGVISGPGGVKKNVDMVFHENVTSPPAANMGAPNVKYDIPLTNQQYDAAKLYAEDAVGQAANPSADWGTYRPFRNSCIDFTWSMMKEAGLNPVGQEGAIRPISNTPIVDKAYYDYYRRPEFNKESRRSPIAPSTGNTPDPLVKTVKYVPYVDPLILDLDGDGLEIIRLNGADSVKFDTDADGLKTATAWAASDDGFVVLDRNANGTIDSGRELFGDETVLGNGQKATDGFAALSELDSNRDGVFGVADAQFGAVRIWRDLNQDGVSQAGELKSLTDSGVASINLVSTASSVKYPDAQLIRDGNFTRANGSTGQAGSFLLGQNNFFTEYAPIPVSAEASVLPDFAGTGKVRNLREAATLSPELVGMVHAAQNATTRAGYKQAVADLMLVWGNDSPHQNVSKAALAQGYGVILSEPQDAQERGWMDQAIKASKIDRVAFRSTLSATEQTKFDAMRERMVGGLERMAAYEAFTGFTFLSWAKVQADTFTPPTYSVPSGQPVEVWAPLSQIIAERRIATPSSVVGYVLVSIPAPAAGEPHIATLWARLLDDATTNLMPTLRLAKYMDAVNLNITDQGVKFDFGAMDAAVAAVSAANRYEGAALVLDLDRIYGAALEPLGWTGTTQLRSLLQQAGIDADVRRAFNDLGYVLPAANATTGTAGSDGYLGDAAGNNFSAGSGDDLLDGGAGDDVLRGGLGNDRVFGGAGNDQLFGEDGNDTLDGGTGNDTLTGGLGNNTFLFGRGDGADWISYSPNDLTVGKLNTLQLKAGVAPADLVLRQVWSASFGTNTALEVSIVGTTDKIVIDGFFQADNPSGGYNPVQQFRFDNGTVWNLATIQATAFAGTAAADAINGTTAADTISGGAGNDTLYGRTGDDALFGGADNDTLIGEAGNDTLDGGTGNDSLNGGLGNNTFLFGRGDGADSIFYSPNDLTAGKLNTLQLKAGVAPTDLVLRQVWSASFGTNAALEVVIAGTTDKITLDGFFQGNNPSGGYNPVQQFQFDGGTLWNLSMVVARVGANAPTSVSAELMDGDGLIYAGSHRLVEAMAGFCANSAMHTSPLMRTQPWRSGEMLVNAV